MADYLGISVVVLTRAVICLTVVFLSACLNTNLSAPSISPEVFRLAATNERLLGLSVEAPPIASAGHQFLFFVIPFGRISLAQPDRNIRSAVYSQLSLKGFKPILDPDQSSPPALTLRITATDLSISAYDLFFTRRIASRIALTFGLYRADQKIREISAVGNYSEFNSLGFEPQLQAAFNQALAEALAHGLEIL